MSTIGRQFKPKRSFANGVDNTTPLESPEIANTLSEGLNCEMVDSDIIKTRNGFTAITLDKNNYIIREGIEYVKSNGTRENIVYLESTTITGNSGILGRIVGDTIVNITTGLPDGIKPCMIQAGVLLFVFNGTSDFIYDGSTTRQIGIDYPTTPPSLIQLPSGNLNEGGFYVYVYTYYNSITGAESSPSLPSETFTTGTTANNQTGIQISVTPGNSLLADTIVVYRTVSGGTTFYYDGETYISATNYYSFVSDQGLGTELELDNSRLPEAAQFAVLVDNRLFVGGFKSNPNRLQHSKIGINGTMYESFQIADIVDCNINDGDTIIGLGKMGTKVGVVKSRKAGKLIPLDSSSGLLQTGGSQKYIYKELPEDCTATNHHSIFNLGGNMGWLGTDNVYLSDGLEVRPVANRIRNTIRQLNFNQSYKFSSYTIAYNHQQLFSVVRSGQTEPDYQLVVHYKDFPTLGWTMWGPGSNPTTHPGIPLASIWSATLNNVEQPYFGSSNSNGKVYQLGLGTSDGGYPIYFSVKDQWEAGADAMTRKSFQSVKYLATTNAASPNNIIYNTWEEDGKDYVVKTQTSTITPSIMWNTANWDTFNWAGTIFTLVRFYPNRKTFLGRFGCYNDKLDSPIAIKSMRLLYRPVQE